MLSFRRFGSLQVPGTRGLHSGAGALRVGSAHAVRAPRVRSAATLAVLVMAACVTDVSGLAVARTGGDESFEKAKEKILSSLGAVGKDHKEGEDEVT